FDPIGPRDLGDYILELVLRAEGDQIRHSPHREEQYGAAVPRYEDAGALGLGLGHGADRTRDRTPRPCRDPGRSRAAATVACYLPPRRPRSTAKPPASSVRPAIAPAGSISGARWTRGESSRDLE